MDKQLQEKLLAKDKWLRFVFVILFLVFKYLVSCLVSMIAVFQFIADLLCGAPNAKLLEFSRRLNLYLLQIANFLTFNSEAKPFPFSDFPEN